MQLVTVMLPMDVWPGPPIRDIVMYSGTFVSAYAMTLAVELPILYLVLRTRVASTSIVVTGIAANACTLSVVWFVFPLLLGRVAYVLVSEVFAIGVECLIVKLALRVDWRIALVASALMNFGSYLLGLLLLR
jgi:hypothetical protein